MTKGREAFSATSLGPFTFCPAVRAWRNWQTRWAWDPVRACENTLASSNLVARTKPIVIVAVRAGIVNQNFVE